jgi:hypothetical protein
MLETTSHFSLTTPGPGWSPMSKTVWRLFHEAWPDRKRCPNFPACARVATAMAIVKSVDKRKGVKRLKPLSPLGEAAEPARLVLKHLPAARNKLQPLDIRQNYRPPDQLDPIDIEALRPEFREIIELIDRMAAAEREVYALLAISFPFIDHRNAAWFIGREAREAWYCTDETLPGWTSEPLCKFVTLTLAAIGRHYAEDSVREMLRNRDRRPRSGKRRGVGANRS